MNEVITTQTTTSVHALSRVSLALSLMVVVSNDNISFQRVTGWRCWPWINTAYSCSWWTNFKPINERWAHPVHGDNKQKMNNKAKQGNNKIEIAQTGQWPLCTREKRKGSNKRDPNKGTSRSKNGWVSTGANGMVKWTKKQLNYTH